MDRKIFYGKGNIAIYRSYGKPLTGLKPIPESAYTGQSNGIFATDLLIEVFGDGFMPAYTEGDNSNVVATATMTNFALQKARTYQGATQEGYLYYLGQEMLKQYPMMESLRLSTKELPFTPAPITTDGGKTVLESDRLFAPNHDSYGFSLLELGREGNGIKILNHECGRQNIKLVKLTGNAFANFQRDEFTTLPERVDRLLFIFLDMGWRYKNVEDAVSDNHTMYMASQQIYDHIQHTFHDFVNMSIQHLVHEMGIRLFDRFSQMEEVWFTAQNRLWDTAAEASDEKEKVYMDPRPPFGQIGLRLHRDEMNG